MEILQQRDEPSAIAGKRFAGLLYGTGAYGNSIIGNAESVSRIALDDVRRFYAAHYLPNASSVVISGLSMKPGTVKCHIHSPAVPPWR